VTAQLGVELAPPSGVWPGEPVAVASDEPDVLKRRHAALEEALEAGLHVPLSGELGAFGGRAVAKEAGVAECAPQGRTGEALEGRAARREAPQLALGGLAERSLELLPGCTPGTFYSG